MASENEAFGFGLDSKLIVNKNMLMDYEVAPEEEQEKPEIDIHKIFMQDLKKASKIVATWPAWKRGIMPWDKYEDETH